MWRDLLRLVVTAATMLGVFLGLRDIAPGFLPEWSAGRIETAAYLVSVTYGLWFFGWLSRWIGPRGVPND